jgi:retron-type reverse transcriptase
MKRFGNIYKNIYDYENLKIAHKNARKGKSHYKDVKMVNKNERLYLEKLQNNLINKAYKTSDYVIKDIIDKGKNRTIYKLPYFPDRICQWAIMLQIEDIFLNTFCDFSCASIPDRGIHHGLKLMNKYMQDEINTKYCLKLDIKKFFDNIDHKILKSLLRKKIKDKNLLWLLDEIIDSIGGDKGVPIGNYTSQYFANFYLTYFDHWLKEELKIKYVVRYMDDIVIFSNSKTDLKNKFNKMEEYLKNNLKLKIKENYQIFPTRVRGVDFIGYRHFGNYILLRKSTAKSLKRKMSRIYKKVLDGKEMTYSEWCSINSYKGWIKWCDGYNLYKKYIKPLEPHADNYYIKNIKT